MVAFTWLELALMVFLAICVHFLLKLYRSNKVLRWGYISMSDWCAYTIDEVTESAKMMASDEFSRSGKSPSEKEISDRVHTNITRAKEEWGKELDRQMQRLRNNGVAKLESNDKQLILNDWFK